MKVPLAILAYSFAETLGGNGFISAFAAGIGLRLGATSLEIRHRMQEFGETEGTQLILVVFLLFGLSMVPAVIAFWGWMEFVYAHGISALPLSRRYGAHETIE